MTRFFDASNWAAQELGALFNFVWPAVTGLRRLRNEVTAWIDANPGASDEQLRVAFFQTARGSDAKNNLRAAVKTPWATQERVMANVILTNAFAIYEGWCHEICVDTVAPAGRKKATKGLQFPTDPTFESSAPFSMKTMHGQADADLVAAFPLAGLHTMVGAEVEALLWTYRVFKELRNCVIHKGGLVNQRAVDALARVQRLTPQTFVVPPLPQMAVGTRVSVDIYAAVGVCNVLLRTIEVLDNALLTSRSAWAVLAKRWALVFPNHHSNRFHWIEPVSLGHFDCSLGHNLPQRIRVVGCSMSAQTLHVSNFRRAPARERERCSKSHGTGDSSSRSVPATTASSRCAAALAV